VLLTRPCLVALHDTKKQVKRKANHEKAKREQERLAARRTAAAEES
jgi:hypothetical protein